MTTSIRYLAVIVLVHLAGVVVHSAAHIALGILPGPLDTAYIVAVIVAGPLAALPLLRSKPLWGVGALAGLMIASFAYGVDNHFLGNGPDRVTIATTLPWTTLFVVSAALIGVLEIIGFALAASILSRIVRTPSAPSGPQG
jgi:hypothetical protein